MTYAGLRFVALSMAALTIGALGYAVHWAYSGPEPPAAKPAPEAAKPREPAPKVTNSVQPREKKPGTGVAAVPPRPPAAPTPAEPAKPAPAASPVAEAPVAPKSVAPNAEKSPPAAAAPGPRLEKSAALPPPESRREEPAVAREIIVVRGGRVRTSTVPRARDEPKYAALPSRVTKTASDAQPILVIRGGRVRYAMASAAEPAPPSELMQIVVRGAPPVRFVYYVPPGPLILHVRD